MNDEKSIRQPYLQMVEVGRFACANLKPNYGKRIIESSDLNRLQSMRAGAIREGKHDFAGHISLEILLRECSTASKKHDAQSHNNAVIALVSAFKSIAGPPRNRQAKCARRLARDLFGENFPTKPWLKDYLAGPTVADASLCERITGMRAAVWSDFAADVREEGESRTRGISRTIAEQHSDPLDLDAATRLLELAEADVATQLGTDLEYDRSDANVRLEIVRVRSFRGSPHELEVSFIKGGRAVDALIWGDNGVGKSTIADGIEFCLQGRVDRSIDFNGALRPAVRNLNSPSATTSVRLSDGSTVDRSIRSNRAGRDEASDSFVRAGFRIAPMIIRRADILRFLDTDALSRGTVFFDYFPNPDSSIGTRPDEELKSLEEEQFVLRVVRDSAFRRLRESYPEQLVGQAQGDFESFVEKVADLDTRTVSLQEKIEALPPDVRKSVADWRKSQQRLKEIKKKLDRGVETLNPRVYEQQLARVVPNLQEIGPVITNYFKKLAGVEHISAIRVLVAKSGPVSLDVVVEFSNGKSAFPQQVFSEGYKDLIALLFFLAVTKRAAEYGQAKVLVLDDALQSVDSSVRLNIADFILTEFADWQLIFMGHDRSWLEQLRALYRQRGRAFIERKISRWSFEAGAVIQSGGRSKGEAIQSLLETGDVRMIASSAGMLLEEICQEMSYRLGISVVRKREDKYTLGDLWPGIFKKLKKTSLSEIAERVHLRVHLRNMIGAHYADWATQLSQSDVEVLAAETLNLYRALFCEACLSWVTVSGPTIGCGCGALVLDSNA